ncbi:hypothetical protein [Methanolobus sp. ZRKC5]|uniref:hypothetical protein n=1 Tax=unclassified Methanolobus TaxID=2629569 RepID=UPI00313C6F1F
MDVNVTSVLEMPIWWPNNISVGVFFFLLGVTGAGIIVYLGSWDKLMGNTARILELQDQTESVRELLKETTDNGDKDRLWQEIVRKENELNKEKWFFRYLGIILYLFVGGMIASILANSMLEAVAFGAGWTGLIGVFGIKKDVDERMKRRDEDKSLDQHDAEVIKNNYEDKIKEYSHIISETRNKIEDMEEKLKDSYYSGYADAIEKVAQLKGLDSKELTEEIIEKL